MALSEFKQTVATGGATRLWKRYGLTSPRELVLEDLGLAMGVVVIEGPLDGVDPISGGAGRGNCSCWRCCDDN